MYDNAKYTAENGSNINKIEFEASAYDKSETIRALKIEKWPHIPDKKILTYATTVICNTVQEYCKIEGTVIYRKIV